MSKKNIGPLSIVSYFSFTLIFFIIKNKVGLGRGITWIVVFVAITGIMQFMNNIYLTTIVCDNSSISTAFFATLIPWTFIFGLSMAMLILIPGWVRVFSNTFGSMIADLAGLRKTVSDIFINTTKENTTDYEIKQTIEIIIGNKTKIINEVNLDDYILNQDGTILWKSLDTLFTFMKSTLPNNEKKKELYDLLVLKEDVGYFIWFLLIGSISILVSTNSILISKCSG